MDEALQAAQQALIAKRKALGLDEQGRRPPEPPIPSLGEVLKRVLTDTGAPPEQGGRLASTLFHSEEACTRKCERCGQELKPVEWELFELKRYAPSNCPVCTPIMEAERAEEEARHEREKRCIRYKGAFPLDIRIFKATNLAEFGSRPGAEKAVEAARRFIDGLPTPDPAGVLLHGKPGNGKSNLAAIIAEEARQRFMGVAYIDAKDWFRNIGRMEPADREALIDIASAAELVVLDEIGVRRPTGPQAEWMLSIVDAVYRRKGNIVVTTNHEPDALAEAISPIPQGGGEPDFLAGERILDRLAEVSVFIRNQATSYRFEQAARRAQGSGGQSNAGT